MAQDASVPANFRLEFPEAPSDRPDNFEQLEDAWNWVGVVVCVGVYDDASPDWSATRAAGIRESLTAAGLVNKAIIVLAPRVTDADMIRQMNVVAHHAAASIAAKVRPNEAAMVVEDDVVFRDLTVAKVNRVRRAHGMLRGGWRTMALAHWPLYMSSCSASQAVMRTRSFSVQAFMVNPNEWLEHMRSATRHCDGRMTQIKTTMGSIHLANKRAYAAYPMVAYESGALSDRAAWMPFEFVRHCPARFRATVMRAFEWISVYGWSSLAFLCLAVYCVVVSRHGLPALMG